MVVALSYSSAFSCKNCMFANNTAAYGSAVAALKVAEGNSTMAIDLTGSKFSGAGSPRGVA